MPGEADPAHPAAEPGEETRQAADMTPEDASETCRRYESGRPIPPGECARRNAEMVQAARSGATYTEVAKRFGLSLSWTGVILRAGGVPVPEHGKGVKLHGLDWTVYAAAYDSGDTIRAIAAAEGLTYSTVHRGLKAAGVTLRPRSGPRKR